MAEVTVGAAGAVRGEPDEARLQHVCPPGWTNPRPEARYDLIVIGGGTAGLVCAMGAAALGATVALAERHLLGGDCLNTGCVPSKALLYSARTAAALARGADCGVRADHVRADFGAVMERMRERRATLAAHDAAARLTGAGVDVFLGEARFAGSAAVQVGDTVLRFRRAVVATGSEPSVSAIPGIESVPFLTSDTIFDLGTRPDRLLVLGGGAIGCELAQAFARFGARVILVEQGDALQPADDPDAAAIVRRQLEADGVQVELSASVARVEARGGDVILHRADGAKALGSGPLAGDALLVATGRVPVVRGLGLEVAGIEATPDGVVVNDFLQTTNRRVYASGDVCTRRRFTHAADAMSRLVVQNALFFGRKRASTLVIPAVTYTDPEVAQAGLSWRGAARAGRGLETITVPLTAVDRAVLDDATDGFVRVYHERGRLRGCTIVARHAGEMMAEVMYALTHGGTLGRLSATVHPYPTLAEGLRKAGDAWRRQSLTPGRRGWLQRYFRWTRWT